MIITLESIGKIKAGKERQESGLKNISLMNSLRKHQQTLKWLLGFEWLLIPYDYLILTFIGLFQQAKIHFRQPNSLF